MTKDEILRYWNILKHRVTVIGEKLQGLFMGVALFFVYLIGFGLTKAFGAIFFQKHLGLYKRNPGKTSYWLEPTGYSGDRGSLTKQV